MKKILTYIYKILVAFISVFVVLVKDFTVTGIQNGASICTILSTYGYYNLLISVIVFILVLFLFKFSKEKEDIICSLIFSFFMYIGLCYRAFKTIFFFYVNTYLVLTLLLYFVGWFFMYNCFICYCKKAILIINKECKKEINISDRKFVLSCMLIILTLWSPYIILRYPAGVESDAVFQILQGIGKLELTNHWPAVSSLLMGVFFKLSKQLFGDYSIGAISFVIFQSLICAYVLSYSLLFIKKRNGNLRQILVILLTYAINPLFPGYLTSIVKDALFSIFVLFFTILFIETFIDNKGYVKVTIVGILMCLLRNNGIEIIIFELLAVFVYWLVKKEKGKLIICLIIVALLNSMYQNVVLPFFSIKKGSIAEALSIPFQQTARLINYDIDQIDKEDFEIIESVFEVDSAVNDYDPYISDPIKGTYKGDNSKLLDYFKVWFKYLFKCPKIYIDATLNNIYGFINPESTMKNRLNCSFYSGKAMFECPLNDLADSFEEIYLKTLETSPITKFFCHVAFWNMTIVYMFIYSLFKKKYTNIIYLMPCITSILVVLASPTYILNGFRYNLPVVYSAPFIMWLIFSKCKNRKVVKI